MIIVLRRITYALGRTRATGSRLLDLHFGFVILLPTLVLIIGTFVYPISMNLWLSFTDKSLLGSANFVGFKNYWEIVRDPVFATSIVNSLIWTISSVGLQFLVGLGFALLLFWQPKGTKIFRIILLTPWMVPIIVLALIWKWMLGGLAGVLPYSLWRLGLTATMISPLGMRDTVLPTLILIDVWRAFPLMMIALLAGLQAVPNEQLEVARIEGASSFQTFRYVIWPNILRISGMLLALRTIWTFNTFDRLYLLSGGGPGIASQTLPLYVYKKAWFSLQVGKGSAMSIVMVMMLCILIFFYVRYFRLLGEKR